MTRGLSACWIIVPVWKVGVPPALRCRLFARAESCGSPKGAGLSGGRPSAGKNASAGSPAVRVNAALSRLVALLVVRAHLARRDVDR
jgi:hypothetical protein